MLKVWTIDQQAAAGSLLPGQRLKPHPDVLSQSLHGNKISRPRAYTLKFVSLSPNVLISCWQEARWLGGCRRNCDTTRLLVLLLTFVANLLRAYWAHCSGASVAGPTVDMLYGGLPTCRAPATGFPHLILTFEEGTGEILLFRMSLCLDTWKSD